VRTDLGIDRTTPNGHSDLIRHASATGPTYGPTSKTGKVTNPSNDIQHGLEQRISSWRTSPRGGLEQIRNQICRDMELAVLDAFEETLGSLLCSQSFVRRLNFTRNGRLCLVLLIETMRVHRGWEEGMGSDTVEEALGAKAFC